MRYEEGFVEPERGFPYGTWMRASEETRRPMNNLGGNSKYNFPQGRAASGVTVEKTGAETFGAGVRGDQHGAVNENWNPNIQISRGRDLNRSWRRDDGEGSVSSSASFSSGGRKRLVISGGKRKVTDVTMAKGANASKKPLLRLRDEDIMSTAVTAEQSRRPQ